MPIADQIFNSPVNITNLLGKGWSEAQCVDSLWTNFMYYAKNNWTYIASARAGGEDLLSGEVTQVPCGGIATALKILLEEGLHQDVDYITIPGYVWTKADYLCFDRRVRGNISRAESPALFNEGCLFNEHYFIKCGEKYYDPCLDSIYEREDDAIRKRYANPEIISRGSLMAGMDANSVLVFQNETVVPGWQRGAWLIVRADKLLKYVKEKNDLLLISCKVEGDVGLTARKESRKLFDKAKRLEFWRSKHREYGINVD